MLTWRVFAETERHKFHVNFHSKVLSYNNYLNIVIYLYIMLYLYLCTYTYILDTYVHTDINYLSNYYHCSRNTQPSTSFNSCMQWTIPGVYSEGSTPTMIQRETVLDRSCWVKASGSKTWWTRQCKTSFNTHSWI